MQETRVISITGDSVKAKESLMGVGSWEDREVEEPISWQLKSSNGVVTAYFSGKVVIQGGSREWIDETVSLLGVSPNNAPQNRPDGEFVPRVGCDEAGKGDFFGPLVVGAVFVENSSMERELVDAGVRDSKKLSDGMIVEIARSIGEICDHRAVIVVTPEIYNERYPRVRNANKILADAHAQAIEDILTEITPGSCKKVVIDQFSKSKFRVLDALQENGRRMEIEQRHKGESDTAVAAGSILGRARFLEELSEISKKYGMEFPKGASQVVPFGKEFVRKYGPEELERVAKTSFRTALQITSTFDI